MSVTVRFAPSPTGLLHIGNARTALFNWLFAKRHSGRFILRFDDTDRTRSRKEYAEAAIEDLAWLGIEPDRIEYQSARHALYDEAVARLKKAERLYPCYETPEELKRRRRLRLARRLPPVFGREALTLSDDERRSLEAEGRRPHWRFLLPNFADDPARPERTEIAWNDLMRGPQSVDLASMSDPVLLREDGSYLYTLPSVVDDIDMGITHVIRGDDHVTNTAAQIALARALGGEAPAFGHHNLLTAASGEGLSKRSGALSLRGLREAGIEPMAVASLAVLIGTAQSVAPVPDLGALAALFDPAGVSRSAARFDPAELSLLNRQYVHAMPYEEVAARLAAMGIVGEKAKPFWLAVRANLDTVAGAAEWWRIVVEGPEAGTALSPQDADYVRAALEMLPPEPWSGETWRLWTETVKARTGRKGRALFAPLRLALTGRPAGPELADLLPLLGREETLARRP